MIFEAAALQGPSPSNLLGWVWSWNLWKYLDFLFLKRYGSWKSNSWIKSYGFRKLVVHRSVRYPDFRDISAVLTLILTHELWLEWEFDNLLNGISSNPFDSWIKIRVYGPTRDQLWVKLGQSGQKSPRSSGLVKNHEKCCFVRMLTSFDLWSTLGWPGAFWSFYLKNALWVLWYPNKLCHVILDVLAAP